MNDDLQHDGRLSGRPSAEIIERSPNNLTQKLLQI